MTDKELKRLNQSQLIDIIYELQRRNKQAEIQMNQLQKALDEQTICMEKIGSLSEAGSSVSNIFETAQTSAEQYLRSIQLAMNDMNSRLSAAEIQKQTLMMEAEQKANKIVQEAKQEAARIIADANAQTFRRWESVEKRAGEILAAHTTSQDPMCKDEQKQEM